MRSWFLRDGQQIEAPSNASSFVLFSPRPHRQLAVSSAISFDSGAGYCRVAGPGEISRDRSSEETLERHPSWGVSQWMREKKKKRREKTTRGARPPRREAHMNPEERKGEKKRLFLYLFFFFPLSRSLLIPSLRCEKGGREEERERERRREREGEERERHLFCSLALSSFFLFSSLLSCLCYLVLPFLSPWHAASVPRR